MPELEKLVDFLRKGTVEPNNPIPRPQCPVRSPGHQSLATYSYKAAMVEYVAGWGFRFSNIPVIKASVLEAVANCLEARAKTAPDGAVGALGRVPVSIDGRL